MIISKSLAIPKISVAVFAVEASPTTTDILSSSNWSLLQLVFMSHPTIFSAFGKVLCPQFQRAAVLDANFKNTYFFVSKYAKKLVVEY